MNATGGEATGELPGGKASGAVWRVVTLVALAALGAIVLVALILTLGEANRQRDRALALQTHSYEVMILSANLSGTIARAEASLGRYVISMDTRLGQVYSADWQLAGQQLARLDLITHDNSQQQALIGRLRRAFNVRNAELSAVALNVFYQRKTQALGLYYKAGEAPSLAEINALLGHITTLESEVLSQRTGAALRSVARSSTLASTLAAFGILLVLGAVALGWLTVTALGQSAVARAEAETERDRATDLEAAVARASEVLLAQESKLRQVQKMEAVGQLTGGIAHDFNNMLAVVLGGLELARRQVNDKVMVRRHIDNAMEGANRAAALTRQLLAFSREEALRSEPIEPVALVRGMSDLLDRTLGDGVRVEMHAEDERAWLVRSDRHQLENAILNLAVNARDAMGGRGMLTIAATDVTLAENAVGNCRAGDYVALDVTDTGCGMTPDMLDRVFEPFFTTKPAGKGTGLGLSQVFAFVRQADGVVGIHSTPGAGTTVSMYLPRYRDRSAEVPAIEVAATPVPVEQAALDILVVEDDPRVLVATMGALEELGHRAVACADPLAAPRMLDAIGRVDLIVSDVLMPGQTGPEMIATLLARHPETAVLFVTGYAGEAGGAAEFGGHHVLRKPFTLIGLERAIDAALASRPAGVIDSIAAE